MSRFFCEYFCWSNGNLKSEKIIVRRDFDVQLATVRRTLDFAAFVGQIYPAPHDPAVIREGRMVHSPASYPFRGKGQGGDNNGSLLYLPGKRRPCCPPAVGKIPLQISLTRKAPFPILNL
jgi:hypothetical protein